MKYAIVKTGDRRFAQQIANDENFFKALGVEMLLFLPLESEILTGKIAEEALQRIHQTIHKALDES